ncbi:MAG: UDP-N-acetylenolpyruvoylglucosamine reductase [Parcubacteria group bacterium GW2011_GWC2_39_14]|nr:MAG: UDP-N-acetylenolpyruvoylglucosamine reductase [Parcubacteria group bacterium GW2011_GWC2_39_14]KKR54560.1 MAG: UDP-N-acetylenolpyruvoylglucosamine reductase [Parcubacteria group bacterium GW2011_GWA2_40_23]
MKEELEQLIGLEVVENEPLKNHTTFRVGGPARYFVKVESKAQLLAALRAAHTKKLAFFILGGGSNVLVADKGFDGLVIKTLPGDFVIKEDLVTAFSGSILLKMIREATKNNLGGLEFAGNIPGTVGGGVRGNCGAYGKGVGDFVKQVEAICLDETGIGLKVFQKDECEFAYRESIFKQNPDWVIAEVVFELSPADFAEESLHKMDEEWQQRCAKQPLDTPSAGCTFKNINFDAKEHEKYTGWQTNGKLAAGKFIEEADLKGMKIGGAMISDKHANFIINFDNATADDIVQLISLVKTRVRNQFGVQFEEEIQYIGF